MIRGSLSYVRLWLLAPTETPPSLELLTTLNKTSLRTLLLPAKHFESHHLDLELGLIEQRLESSIFIGQI